MTGKVLYNKDKGRFAFAYKHNTKLTVSMMRGKKPNRIKEYKEQEKVVKSKLIRETVLLKNNK